MRACEESTVLTVYSLGTSGSEDSVADGTERKEGRIPEGTENGLCRNNGVDSGIMPQIKTTECTPVEIQIAFVKMSRLLLKGGE